VCYDDIATAALSVPFVVIDFSGNPSVLRALHERAPGRIAYVCAVGRTHWEASSDVASLPDPKPKLFFAPERVEKRMADWGPEKFGRSHDEAWAAFTADVPRWLEVHYDQGSDDALRTYVATLRGETSPATGQVVKLAGEPPS
jgi:hypothetical protein